MFVVHWNVGQRRGFGQVVIVEDIKKVSEFEIRLTVSSPQRQRPSAVAAYPDILDMHDGTEVSFGCG